MMPSSLQSLLDLPAILHTGCSAACIPRPVALGPAFASESNRLHMITILCISNSRCVQHSMPNNTDLLVGYCLMWRTHHPFDGDLRWQGEI